MLDVEYWMIIFAAGLLTFGATAETGGQTQTLKDAFKNDFLVGAALNEAEFAGGTPTPLPSSRLSSIALVPKTP